MKKYAPFVFPLLVLGIIFVLVYRWYSQQVPQTPGALGEGVQIENLSASESATLKGIGDFSTVTMEKSQEATVSGVIRYDVSEDSVEFGVIVNGVSETDTTVYKVWVKSASDANYREAFVLEAGKGGLVGSAVLPKEVLPLEVVVGTNDSSAPVLKGMIPAPQAQ